MEEKILNTRKNGMAALLLTLLGYVVAIALFIYSITLLNADRMLLGVPLLILSIAYWIAGIFLFCGLKVLKPQEALVLTLFGDYIGTLKGQGFYWVNPFCTAVNPAAGTRLSQSGDVNSKETSVAALFGQSGQNAQVSAESMSRKISLKMMTLNNSRQKINDCLGNPVEIGMARMPVERLLLPAIDSESHGRLFDTVRRYPDHCTPMMGLHPTSINDNPRWREELALVERYLCSPPEGVGRFCAVGEIGLDYYWDDRFKAEQLEAFTKQCRLAATYDLPVAIHTRAAWKDMCRTVETETKAAREKGLRLRGVFHAFAEDADTYRQLKECGDFLFGIGGVVTFKKSRLADTVREMELDDLVLETDCPYLTPVPYRGQRNESGYIPYICNKIAALKGTTPEEVAAATTRNARRMFGFDAARQTTNDHSSPTESI